PYSRSESRVAPGAEPPSCGTSRPSRPASSSTASGKAMRSCSIRKRSTVPCATPEAMIELLLRAHPEGGGFLVVEGAAGLVLAARFLQLHARADDLHDVRAGDQLVDEALGDDGWFLTGGRGPAGASAWGQLLLHAGTDDTH